MKTYKPNDTARIEAMLFAADPQRKVPSSDATHEAKKWAGHDLRWSTMDGWEVKTLEGWVDMPFGSYLIKGTNNEFYPCAPDVFEKRWVECEV